MATLSIDNITKRFGNYSVIPELSLTIPDGEFCVLVGPSGCGKSTLLRIIAGLEPISSGRILIDGTDIRELDLRQLRQQVAVMTQDTLLLTGTIRDNLRCTIAMCATSLQPS